MLGFDILTCFLAEVMLVSVLFGYLAKADDEVRIANKKTPGRPFFPSNPERTLGTCHLDDTKICVTCAVVDAFPDDVIVRIYTFNSVSSSPHAHTPLFLTLAASPSNRRVPLVRLDSRIRSQFHLLSTLVI